MTCLERVSQLHPALAPSAPLRTSEASFSDPDAFSPTASTSLGMGCYRRCEASHHPGWQNYWAKTARRAACVEQELKETRRARAWSLLLSQDAWLPRHDSAVQGEIT